MPSHAAAELGSTICSFGEYIPGFLGPAFFYSPKIPKKVPKSYPVLFSPFLDVRPILFKVWRCTDEGQVRWMMIVPRAAVSVRATSTDSGAYQWMIKMILDVRASVRAWIGHQGLGCLRAPTESVHRNRPSGPCAWMCTLGVTCEMSKNKVAITPRKSYGELSIGICASKLESAHSTP